MRVVKTNSKRERPISPSKRRKKSPPVERSFSEVLQTEQVGVRDIDLAAALEEVDEYAKRLRESPILENLLPYKKQSYSVQESTVYDFQGRRRLLVLVESIDQKLEELTREFLHRQTSSLDLVGRLDEIRGLLLDLQI